MYFKEHKQDILAWSASIILLFFALGYTVYAVRFLARTLNQALDTSSQGARPIVRFEFDKLEPLFVSGKLQRIEPQPPR